MCFIFENYVVFSNTRGSSKMFFIFCVSSIVGHKRDIETLSYFEYIKLLYKKQQSDLTGSNMVPPLDCGHT